MTPKQMQDRVEQIVNDHNGCASAGAHANRYGHTVSHMTDTIEQEEYSNKARGLPPRKLLYDRVRRAAFSLARRDLIEIDRSRTTITFHRIKSSS